MVGRRLTGLSRQDGFTLPELVMVVVIISILSTIALPVFLNQENAWPGLRRMSNARNLAGQVQQCHEGKSAPDYTSCDTLAELTAENGPLSLPYGSDPGEVEVAAATASTFRVVARSLSGNQFTVELGVGGGMTRDCTTANSAACPPSGHW